ncbi:sugar transferase, partial [Streptomyces griseus]|nr:sugar transferase [Streptomyces griseus]
APAVTFALVVPAPWPWPLVAVQAVAQVLIFARRRLYGMRLSPSALSELPALLGLTLLQWYVTMEVLALWAPQQAIGWAVLAYGAATQSVL